MVVRKSDGSYEEFDREKLINLVKKVFKTANIECNSDCVKEIVDSLYVYDGIMCSLIRKQLIERFLERDENLLNAYMVVMENLDKDMKTYKVGTFVKITAGFHEGRTGRIIEVNTLFRPTHYIVEFCNHTSCEFTRDLLTELPQEFESEQCTRVVEVSLEKAREWYSKGGSLREIALQAFSKEELEQCPQYTYGQLMTVNGMCGYIIGMDESGYPNAWVSDILNIPSPYVFSDCITREDALKLELKGGWHIPSYSEIEELKWGLKKANVSPIIWTTGSDPMCWWGDDGTGRCPHLRPCRAILKK